MIFLLNKLRKKTATSKAFSFVKKLILGPIIAVFVIAFCISIASSSNDNKSASIDTSKYIEYVDVKEVTEFNENGTVNGLNLLLIQSMVEGYCRDYLEITSKAGDGTLTPDCDFKTPLTTILGVAASEQGTYAGSGGYVLVSSLGWNSSEKKSVWDKSKDITLYDVGSESYNSGRVQVYDSGYLTGGYAGPFQGRRSYFSNGTYKKSSLSGKFVSESRNLPDMGYFPDQVAGVNWERKNQSLIIKSSTTSDLKDRALQLATSVHYSGQPLIKYIPHTDEADLTTALNDLSDFTDLLIEECTDFPFATGFKEPQQFKWMAIIAAVDKGAKVSPDCLAKYSNSYQKEAGNIAMELLGKSEDCVSFLSNNVDNSIDGNNNGTGEMSITIGTHSYVLTPEAYFHYVGEEVQGPILYARMLTMGGLTDVDPTNPSTYMNELKKSGEWTPSGDTDWMIECNIDMTKMTDNRAKILNEAHKFLGTPYAGLRPIDQFAPKKNTDGSYDVTSGVLDCSGLTWKVYHEVFGVDIGSNTYEQLENSNLIKIEQSELRPGDIILPHNGHVIIYLSGNSTDGITYLHTGNPRDNCCIKKGVMSYCNLSATWECRRYSGIGD